MKEKGNLVYSLSLRLQFLAIFLSFVGIAFGIKSYLHVREEFGSMAGSQPVWYRSDGPDCYCHIG